MLKIDRLLRGKKTGLDMATMARLPTQFLNRCTQVVGEWIEPPKKTPGFSQKTERKVYKESVVLQNLLLTNEIPRAQQRILDIEALEAVQSSVGLRLI